MKLSIVKLLAALAEEGLELDQLAGERRRATTSLARLATLSPRAAETDAEWAGVEGLGYGSAWWTVHDEDLPPDWEAENQAVINESMAAVKRRLALIGAMFQQVEVAA